jgi:hypothetical protein
MNAISRKQSSRNEEWIQALSNIESLVPEKEYRVAEKKAIADIRKTIKGKKTALAWSGGKDSIVLGHLCIKAGLTASMIGMCNLEYPAFEAWVQANKPEGCEIINTGQDMSWLAKHPEMLFPLSSALIGRWYGIVQHKAQEDYYKRNSLDMLILGRRRADGNYTGTDGLYTNGRGITRFSPLCDWPHEMILAGIHYNRLPLPPIYDWKDGFVQGTHPWPARIHVKDAQQGWQEIFDIDPAIVRAAAETITSAALFLQEVGA